MYSVRLWSRRNARVLESLYNRFESALVYADPLLRRIGYERLDKPVAFVEKAVKGFLFDCQMCGQCVLSSTGMACPMNCPKQLRNGPCGGVSSQGYCEVEPTMRCVWVEAAAGASQMRGGQQLLTVQAPVDRRLHGSSAWLRAARRAGQQESAR